MNKLFYKLFDNDLSFYLDEKLLNDALDEIIGYKNYFKWLVPSLIMDNSQNQHYVWDLIDNKISCNFPLLVCGDDRDFSCTIVIVKLKFDGNFVLWQRIGIVEKDEKFRENWRNSGIRNTEMWTDADWKNYSLIADDILSDDCFFEKWCSENWAAEEYRRTWGYYHKRFNDDNCVKWLCELSWKFDLQEYISMFDEIRHKI